MPQDKDKQMENRNESQYKSSGQYSGSARNLSDAARTMRSGNPEERREGAAQLGRAGGKASHGGHRTVVSGGGRNVASQSDALGGSENAAQEQEQEMRNNSEEDAAGRKGDSSSR